jgi:mono/diheme cytochrome c family protein
MSRAGRPVVVGAVIVVAVFALAQAQIFEPATDTGGAATAGDVVRGEQVFASECASCHGTLGEGGAGPALAGSGLDADEVTTRIREGGGIMPAGLVSGQDEADVVAYVVSITDN